MEVCKQMFKKNCNSSEPLQGLKLLSLETPKMVRLKWE